MKRQKLIVPISVITRYWRFAALVILFAGSLGGILSLDAVAQDADYHLFADTREFLLIPHFFDVVSNLPFLVVGAMGLRFCLNAKRGETAGGWVVLFVGISLVSIGSSYYHWNPNNDSLLWDRLPMTIGFMGLFVALIDEYIGKRIALLLIAPAITLGLASVLYWYWSDDLRLYFWVQLLPLLTIPAVMILFRSNYTHQWLLFIALFWYVLAKLAEFYDNPIFLCANGLVSGHTLKHLMAATSCYCILIMLQRRGRRNKGLR